jgi:hypothetical protein
LAAFAVFKRQPSSRELSRAPRKCDRGIGGEPMII